MSLGFVIFSVPFQPKSPNYEAEIADFKQFPGGKKTA